MLDSSGLLGLIIARGYCGRRQDVKVNKGCTCSILDACTGCTAVNARPRSVVLSLAAEHVTAGNLQDASSFGCVSLVVGNFPHNCIFQLFDATNIWGKMRASRRYCRPAGHPHLWCRFWIFVPQISCSASKNKLFVAGVSCACLQFNQQF